MAYQTRSSSCHSIANPPNGSCRSSVAQPVFVVSERQFDHIVAGETVALIETGKSALGSQIEWVLCDYDGSAADGRSIVNGFRECIGAADGEPGLQSLAHAE